MKLLLTNRVAWTALGRNKLRASLAILGIAIGVGAVVSMVAIGDGASLRVRKAIDTLGPNMVWVEEGGVNRGGVRTGLHATKSLTVGDADAIRTLNWLVTNVCPHVDTRAQVIYGNQNWRTQIRGEAPAFLGVRAWTMAAGEMFTDHDVLSAANVCVIGQTTWKNLFGSEDPVGKMVRAKNVPVRVLGVLAVKGQSPTGQDQDDAFVMPYTTVQKKLMGQPWLDDIMCTALSTELIPDAEREITGLLRERHHIQPGGNDDFNLRHPVDVAEMVAKSTETMEIVLASIAAISMLVGGIGIMNIMLVSVTERTREIGIRMSVGAKSFDIQIQFFWEALILAVAGGAFGIGLGAAASEAISRILQWPVHMSLTAVEFAFGCSSIVGAFFGFYPALKASRLEPVDALRYEV